MPEVLTAEPTQGIIKAPTTRSATGTPLIDAARISRRVRRLGKEISVQYQDIDTALVLVVILKGATVFAADLMRSLDIAAERALLRAATYGSGTASNCGSLRLARM